VVAGENGGLGGSTASSGGTEVPAGLALSAPASLAFEDDGVDDGPEAFPAAARGGGDDEEDGGGAAVGGGPT
jgi:hypothetical protein